MLIRSPKELALSVATERKKRKLSQADVGKRVGLKQQTVSEFERRPEGTKLGTLFSILSAIHLDIQLSTKDETPLSNASWKEEW